MNYSKALYLLRINATHYDLRLVKKQYRLLSKKLHPDLHPNEQKKYNKIFIELKDAYIFLITKPIKKNIPIFRTRKKNNFNKPFGPRPQRPQGQTRNSDKNEDNDSDIFVSDSKNIYRPCDYCKISIIKRYLYKGYLAKKLFSKKNLKLCESCFYRFNTTVCNICGIKLTNVAKVYYEDINSNKYRFKRLWSMLWKKIQT